MEKKPAEESNDEVVTKLQFSQRKKNMLGGKISKA
jgi:hypothetical protein